MSDVLQQLYLPACIISWIGVAVALFVRIVQKQRAYLRRMPWMKDIWLDMLATPPMRVQLEMIRAIFEPQSDPDVERLRREVLRSFLFEMLWMVLYPFLLLGVFTLLVLSRLMH